MGYYDALAPQLDETMYDVATPQPRRARLTAYEGGGLDASVREQASPSFFARIAIAVVLVVALCVIGSVRVMLSTGTVAILQNNQAVSSQIKEIRALNSDLQIERSLFSASDRIGRIATQNLGMVHASEVERLELD